MSKFLNTSALNYYLEELIKRSKERVVLISPYLKFNDRLKELIQDKNALKLDIRIVYGKSELESGEAAWLKGLTYVRTTFCKNLHAKCYLNESACIIGSLNLYEFSQVNNNEMGVLLSLRDDPEPFKAAQEEAQRILRLSEEIETKAAAAEADESQEPVYDKLTTSKLAQKMGVSAAELIERLMDAGFLEDRSGRSYITTAGRTGGGEFKMGRAGPYFLWPCDLVIPEKVGFLATFKKRFF